MDARMVDGKSESAYHCVEGRLLRPFRGGSACKLLSRRYDGHVELLFHADPSTGAQLTDAQAREVAHALLEAADAR